MMMIIARFVFVAVMVAIAVIVGYKTYKTDSAFEKEVMDYRKDLFKHPDSHPWKRWLNDR